MRPSRMVTHPMGKPGTRAGAQPLPGPWTRQHLECPKYVHPLESPNFIRPTCTGIRAGKSLGPPVFAADAQTGTIYVSGSGPVYTVDPATVARPKVDPSVQEGVRRLSAASVSRSRTFIRASHDQARTWAYLSMDSDEYPGGGKFQCGSRLSRGCLFRH